MLRHLSLRWGNFQACREKVRQDIFVLWSGDLFVGSDVATEKETLMLLFPYFVGLNQIEMSGRARNRHCRLLSLVNFGAFTTKRSQRKQVEVGEGGEGGGENNLLPSIHTHQLEAPSRSRCRRCLRILAIFRPAAPDENSSPLLFFFLSSCRMLPSHLFRREKKSGNCREYGYSGE